MDVTLTWFRNLSDPVYTDNADPLQQTLTTTDIGFANLHLQIWDANFTHLFASSMSIYNTVQELHYTLELDGEYGLRVTYDDQMFGDPVPEDYGLAWSVTVVPEPGVAGLCGLAGVLILVVCRRKKTPRLLTLQ